jgi:hypothetical protein
MSDTDRPVVGSVTPPPAMEVVGGRGEIASVVLAADVVVGGRLVVDVVVGGSVVVDVVVGGRLVVDVVDVVVGGSVVVDVVVGGRLVVDVVVGGRLVVDVVDVVVGGRLVVDVVEVVVVGTWAETTPDPPTRVVAKAGTARSTTATKMPRTGPHSVMPRV